MQEPDLEEEALNGHQEAGNLVIERRTMKDRVDPVTVTLPSGRKETVTLQAFEPGLWRGQFTATEPGLHRLSDGTLEAVAAIGSTDAREAADLLATDRILKPVSAASGGGIAWTADGVPRLVKVASGRSAAGQGWLGLRSNGAYRVLSVRAQSLFATLLGLGALLLAICAMWFREGR